MTLSEDLNFADQGGEFDSGASPYPVVFGVSFTPKIIGMIAGVVGLLGAFYILFNLVMPAWDSYQQQQARNNDLQGAIAQKKAAIKQIDQVKQELAEAKQQQIKVLGLFANETTLDTLLLDMNRLIESSNEKVPLNAVKAKLQKFTPATEKSEPVTDGSLGVGVNGKLKRTNINVEIVGTYEQTQSILRNIERLQPLLIVKDYQSALAPVQTTNQAGKPIRQVGPAPITTSFQLQALMPLTPEEIAAAAKAPPQ
jgi:type IV pilus assembly protein PilO